MSKLTYKSPIGELIAFAKDNGVELPEGTDKPKVWEVVKGIMVDMGDTPPAGDEQNENTNQAAATATQSTAKKSKDPTHYTISISRPTDVKQPDLVICANGTNYQIHYGKKVKVPAVVLNILKDAVERKPAYRDMETNEWIEESFEPRYSFAIHEEHFQ